MQMSERKRDGESEQKNGIQCVGTEMTARERHTLERGKSWV